MKHEEWSQADWEDLHRSINAIRTRVEQRRRGITPVRDIHQEILIDYEHRLRLAESRLTTEIRRNEEYASLLRNWGQPNMGEWLGKVGKLLDSASQGRTI